MRRVRLRWLLLVLVAAQLSLGGAATFAQEPVTIEDLILLAQSDLTDDTILVFLDYREIGFAVGSAEIVQLREGSVSEGVIRYLIERSSAPVAQAPQVRTASYPSRYYATFLGSGPAFYRGADYYPWWWWNDYHFLHISPRHNYSGGHHLYSGLHGHVGRHYDGHYNRYGGYGGNATYGHQRTGSYSAHLRSGGRHLAASGSLAPRHNVNGTPHRPGSSFGGSHIGSNQHSSSHFGSAPRSSHSSGVHFGGTHSGGGYSNGGHSTGGHSSGGHSGGGHSGGGH